MPVCKRKKRMPKNSSLNS
jgi:hypothetical protein